MRETPEKKSQSEAQGRLLWNHVIMSRPVSAANISMPPWHVRNPGAVASGRGLPWCRQASGSECKWAVLALLGLTTVEQSRKKWPGQD